MHCCHPILWLGDSLLVTAQAMGVCSLFPEHSIHSGTAGRVQIAPTPADCLSRRFLLVISLLMIPLWFLIALLIQSKANSAEIQICRAETTEGEILHWSCRKGQCNCPCPSSFGSSNRKKSLTPHPWIFVTHSFALLKCNDHLIHYYILSIKASVKKPEALLADGLAGHCCASAL